MTEEFNTLVRAAQRGDNAARNRIVTENLNLVRSRARKFMRAVYRFGLQAEFDDLVAAGVAGNTGKSGIMRAIAKFDCDAGYAFSTYAVRWIDDGIRRSLGGMVPLKHNSKGLKRLPRHVPLHDVNEAAPNVEPDIAIAKRERDEHLNFAVECLTSKEQHVIRRLFWDGFTMCELGREMGLSRQRVQQLKDGAVTKLQDCYDLD